MSWDEHSGSREIDGLVVSGLAELALGALTGWPYALAIADPSRARALGIRSTARMRQWHLDLIALGGLTVLVGTALPRLPARVKWPLAVGAWTNAMSFGVLTAVPELEDHPVYRSSVVGSFVATSAGFVGVAAEGLARWRAGRTGAGSARLPAPGVAGRDPDRLGSRPEGIRRGGPVAYRLNVTEDLPGSVRLCAVEALGEAIGQLERARRDDPVSGVHEARKQLKKTRSLLRLVRADLEPNVYKRENSVLRDVGRSLSGLRDADVMVQTADALSEHFVGQLPSASFDRLREALALDPVIGTLKDALPVAIDELTDAAARAEHWPVEDIDWKTLRIGARRSYALGRDAFEHAKSNPTVNELHEWRKRVKDLWYQERLVRAAWPGPLAAHAEEAHRLSELLGDDHDLALLGSRVAELDISRVDAAIELDGTLRLIAHRREELQTAARALGKRIYGESPKAYSRRLGTYLRAAARSDQPLAID